MIIKAKFAAPTPLELGRLVEDEHLLQAQMEWNRIESSCRRVSHVDINLRCLCCMQALEADRDAAMKECQQSCPQW